MKHLLSLMLLSGLIASAQAEPIKVRIQTRDKKIHIGTITRREGAAVMFIKDGSSSPVRVPDTQIAYVKFPVDDKDEENIATLFGNGEYHKAAKLLQAILPQYVDYITLPSNLSRKFQRWLTAAYWTGDMDRVLSLADPLSEFGTTEMKEQAAYYRGLAQLDTGDFKSLEAYLATPEAEQTYPAESEARLYIDARKLSKDGEYIPAIRTAALMIALHSREADWMPKAELLCAELYYKLDMPESAESVLADIKEFYADPRVKEQAAAIAAKK